jgi:hypothetical protein
MEEGGNPVTIVNIQPFTNGTSPSSAGQTTTEVTVSTSTGNRIVVTNDIAAIKSDNNARYVVQNIISKQPELSVYTPSKTTTVTYGTIKEITVLFTAEREKPVQVTSIVNGSNVQIVNSQTVTVKQISKIQVIPSVAVPIASKKFP